MVTIELRALAGFTYKYVDPTYRPDQAASAISDYNSAPALGSPPTGTFPYLGTPYCGYSYTPAT